MSKKQKILIGLIIITSLISAVLVFLLTSSQKEVIVEENDDPLIIATVTDEISGSVTINGVIPQGSRIKILAREIGTGEFKEYSDLTAEALNPWSIPADNGTVYELRAQLELDNKIIASSDSISVVAPASSESLKINSTQSTNQSEKTSISGTITINGYIPKGATISLYQKTEDKRFSKFGENITPKSVLDWRWNSAIAGRQYEVKAELLYENEIIGESEINQVTAPTNNENLTLNSNFTPPIKNNSTIKGTFDLNGVIPSDSTLLLSVRESGKEIFQDIGSNILPIDNGIWTWNNAQSGIKYELLAKLIDKNGVVISSATTSPITAPASSVVLTLNVTYNPPPPPQGSLTNSCVSKNEKDKWQVSVTVNDKSVLSGINMYHIKIGTLNNDSEFVDAVIKPQSPNSSESVTTDYVLTENTTYYAKYAYENCNCGEFSDFSHPLKIVCKSN